MATKKQIAEQAMRIISGGHLKPDRNVDFREVMLYLDQLRDERCRLDTLNNVKQGDYSVPDAYLTLATGTVSSGTYQLPFQSLELPYGLGLYQVGPTADLDEAYAIMPPGHRALIGGSAAMERSSKGYCWLFNDTIYFKNVSDSTAITVMYVRSSKGVTESDQYPLPPDAEAEILQKLVQMFGVQQQAPHDELEDGQK